MNFCLRKALRSAILETIDTLHIYGLGLVVTNWSCEDVGVLQFALKNDIVSKEDISTQLDTRLRALGRVSYTQHVRRGIEPNHTYSPEAFAYALSVGEFSAEELRALSFGGETLHSFVTLHGGAHVLERVLELLLGSKKGLAAREPVAMTNPCKDSNEKHVAIRT